MMTVSFTFIVTIFFINLHRLFPQDMCVFSITNITSAYCTMPITVTLTPKANQTNEKKQKKKQNPNPNKHTKNPNPKHKTTLPLASSL